MVLTGDEFRRAYSGEQSNCECRIVQIGFGVSGDTEIVCSTIKASRIITLLIEVRQTVS